MTMRITKIIVLFFFSLSFSAFSAPDEVCRGKSWVLQKKPPKKHVFSRHRIRYFYINSKALIWCDDDGKEKGRQALSEIDFSRGIKQEDGKIGLKQVTLIKIPLKVQAEKRGRDELEILLYPCDKNHCSVGSDIENFIDSLVEENAKREGKAATKIQSVWRTKKAKDTRTNLAEEKKKKEAATKIQSAWRGMKARDNIADDFVEYEELALSCPCVSSCDSTILNKLAKKTFGKEIKNTCYITNLKVLFFSQGAKLSDGCKALVNHSKYKVIQSGLSKGYKYYRACHRPFELELEKEKRYLEQREALIKKEAAIKVQSNWRAKKGREKAEQERRLQAAKKLQESLKSLNLRRKARKLVKNMDTAAKQIIANCPCTGACDKYHWTRDDKNYCYVSSGVKYIPSKCRKNHKAEKGKDLRGRLLIAMESKLVGTKTEKWYRECFLEKGDLSPKDFAAKESAVAQEKVNQIKAACPCVSPCTRKNPVQDSWCYVGLKSMFKKLPIPERCKVFKGSVANKKDYRVRYYGKFGGWYRRCDPENDPQQAAE